MGFTPVVVKVMFTHVCDFVGRDGTKGTVETVFPHVSLGRGGDHGMGVT